MIKLFTNLALRNFAKYKFYSATIIFGLMLGLVTCFLISIFAKYELGYDKWLSGWEDIYTVDMSFTEDNGTSVIAKTPLRLKRDVQAYFPEVVSATRLIDDRIEFFVDQKTISEEVWFVDGEFHDVFDLPLVAGQKASFQRDAQTLLLSQELAVKYFGGADNAIGKVITFDAQIDYQVVGVFDDFPPNSHLDMDAIAKYSETDALYNFGYSEDWEAIEGYTYVRLSQGTNAESLNQRFDEFVQNYFPPQLYGADTLATDIVDFRLTNLNDIHLLAERRGDIKQPGSAPLVFTLLAVAALVMVLAIINFLNLTTNRSFKRSREASIRKAIGASRKSLVIQFLSESIVISLISFVLALIVTKLSLSYFRSIAGQPFELDVATDWKLLLVLLAISLVSGVLSGLYPAWKMSSNRPSDVLRSNQSRLQGGSRLVRNALVSLQFVISITLLSVTFVAMAQAKFIEQSDLGFSKENKIALKTLQRLSPSQRSVLYSELNKDRDIESLAFSTTTPADRIGIRRNVRLLSGGQDEPVNMAIRSVGSDFFATYDIDVLEGREFSISNVKDEFSWDQEEGNVKRVSGVLNQAAAISLGFESVDNALGRVVEFRGYELEIVGVVSNTKFLSLRTPLDEILYISAATDFISLTMKYKETANVSALLDRVDAAWQRVVPDQSLIYRFVDDDVNAQYEADEKAIELLSVFTFIAVCIAFLGLYAMISYAIQSRTKEIGIRKVHGASSVDVIMMLVKQFAIPVVSAIVLSVPVSYYLINRYLDTFVYKVDLNPLHVSVPFVSVLALACFIIAGYSFRYARAKPMAALKVE